MIWKIPFIGSHNGAVPPVGGSPVENVFLLEDLGVEGALCKFDPHDDVGEDNCEIMMMSCLTSRSSIVVPGASWKLEEWNGLWRSPSRQILPQPWRVNNLENGPNLSQPYLVKKNQRKEARQKMSLCGLDNHFWMDPVWNKIKKAYYLWFLLRLQIWPGIKPNFEKQTSFRWKVLQSLKACKVER